MRVLIGSILAGHQKDYCISKFEEMCNALFPDVDVLMVVDYDGRTRLPELVEPRIRNTIWATEICYWAKHHALKDYAFEHGYDALVWQGIDCFYSTRAEFDLLVDGLAHHQVVGGLVAGRNRPDYAVCRSFVRGLCGYGTEQDDVRVEDIWTVRQPVPIPGYIGSDATAIRADALKAVSMDGYEHWHLRPDRDELRVLGPDDFWMWSAVQRHGIWPAVDPRVRPWHFHENLIGARFPGQTLPLHQLAWPSIVAGRELRPDSR